MREFLRFTSNFLSSGRQMQREWGTDVKRVGTDAKRAHRYVL